MKFYERCDRRYMEMFQTLRRLTLAATCGPVYKTALSSHAWLSCDDYGYEIPRGGRRE